MSLEPLEHYIQPVPVGNEIAMATILAPTRILKDKKIRRTREKMGVAMSTGGYAYPMSAAANTGGSDPRGASIVYEGRSHLCFYIRTYLSDCVLPPPPVA